MSFSTNSEPSDTSGTAPDLLSLIRVQWERWGLGTTPESLSSLVLTGGPRSISKVVALVFADPSDRPGLVVKMTRVPEGATGLDNEATALRGVHSLRQGGVAGAPRILFCCRRDGLLAVGETALVGRPLSTLVRRRNFRDVALTATDWLCGLVAQPTPVPRDTWWDRLVEPVLANFDESFGAAVDPGMFRETSNLIRTLDAVPLVCEQRDFAPWNTLLTSNGALAVLDWESAELQGLPALDLLYFLTFLTFSLDEAERGDRCRDSHRAALDPATLPGAVRRECLARYASRTGLTDAAIGPLRLLVWLLHSRSEYRRLVADTGGRPGRELLRRSLFVGLWEEEFRNMTRRHLH